MTKHLAAPSNRKKCLEKETAEPGSGRWSYLLPPVRSDGDFASNAKYFSK